MNSRQQDFKILVTKLYPTKKADEINLLAKINSAKDLKQLAEDFGMTKEQIKKQL